MSYDKYEQIRNKNKSEYGPRASGIIRNLLSLMYKERTHFIYELLQNAEDACYRANRKGIKRRFQINFKLFLDRLEVTNNGIEFDDNDIIGICGVDESTKSLDVPQIGKFGIGFKSIYAYTISPEIYSGRESFTIKEYLYPWAINPKKNLSSVETLLVIPFNKPGVNQQKAYDEIRDRLQKLSLRTFLFLHYLSEVSYSFESIEGCYSIKSKFYPDVKNTKQVILQHISGDANNTEKWLVFEKDLDADDKKHVEVAYYLSVDPKTNKEIITQSDNIELFAYFPTGRETHLRFLIQGPYNTTPARDNIHEDDEWNQRLIKETAFLVADSITKIKSMGMLEISFLQTLPIDIDHFTKERTIFKEIYDEVKRKFSSNEALLPTIDGKYANASEALLADRRDLNLLLSSNQIDLLFDKKGGKWLDENITERRTPTLRQYLMSELNIKEIDPDVMARAFNMDFIKQQNDQWVIQFYDFLAEHRPLWEKGSGYRYRDGILRYKPIIRLENDTHVAPFKQTGEPIAYLAHRDVNIRKFFPRIVKNTITSDEKAVKFLNSLGIKEPDSYAAIVNIVLPRYTREIVLKEENVRDVEWILKTISECSSDKREELIKLLQNTPFLYATNAGTNLKEYRTLDKIYLGSTFTGHKNAEVFLDGNEDIWFVDERYGESDKKEKIAKMLIQIGCKDDIEIRCQSPNISNYVIIMDDYGNHKRGLEGFDPYCDIEGLDFALSNITVPRAKLIWGILKKYHGNIQGQVETDSKQNFSTSNKETIYSIMGKKLVTNAWMPLKDGYCKPSDVSLHELPDGFDKNSEEAKYVADKLGFKPSISEELRKAIDDSDIETKEYLETFLSLPPDLQKKAIEHAETLRVRMLEDTQQTREVEVDLEELGRVFRDQLALESRPSNSNEDFTYRGPTPEVLDQIKTSFERDLCEMSKHTKLPERVTKIVREIATQKKDEDTLRAFLLEEYQGHCQICNTRLDLGEEKDPWIEICRLIENRKQFGEWANREFNVISLCPNCHALMKHGGRDLQGITDTAHKWMCGDLAPEEVMERYGDYFIASIIVANKSSEIYYSPVHMAALASFLKITNTII